jgi:hypothetical protein
MFLSYTVRKNAQFRNVLAGGTHNNHCALNCSSTVITCFIINLHVRLLKLRIQFYKFASSHLLNIALVPNINPLKI